MSFLRGTVPSLPAPSCHLWRPSLNPVHQVMHVGLCLSLGMHTCWVAAQVQVAKLGLVLSTKDKKTAVKLRGVQEAGLQEEEAPSQSSSRALAPGEMLGEVQAFYRLTDGEHRGCCACEHFGITMPAFIMGMYQ